jgi:hypothetical protein
MDQGAHVHFDGRQSLPQLIVDLTGNSFPLFLSNALQTPSKCAQLFKGTLQL